MTDYDSDDDKRHVTAQGVFKEGTRCWWGGVAERRAFMASEFKAEVARLKQELMRMTAAAPHITPIDQERTLDAIAEEKAAPNALSPSDVQRIAHAIPNTPGEAGRDGKRVLLDKINQLKEQLAAANARIAKATVTFHQLEETPDSGTLWEVLHDLLAGKEGEQ
jgi:hypothetical protein